MCKFCGEFQVGSTSQLSGVGVDCSGDCDGFAMVFSAKTDGVSTDFVADFFQESPRQTKPKKGPKRKVHEFRPFL